MIFDTTLRDGEQSPGCQMDVRSKILVAKQLERLKVNVIEAGFPISSEGDFKAVLKIAQLISGATICALARTRKEDILRAAEALEKAKRSPRIHVFVATSDVHMEKKLRKSPEEIVEMAVNSVRLARKYVDDVEFSPEDASRTGREFLAKIVKAAIEAGATTINIPDTVGYSVGREYQDLIKYLRQEVPELNSVVLSTHCHNDLGLAVANTLSAIEAGARQLECCVLGIGERAGNAQLEAVVMALKTRSDYYKVQIGLDTRELEKTARLVASIIRKPIPDNLPVVGRNAFAHGAGIHQDGVLKERATYEIMKPEEVGWESESFPLVKHSGRHGLQARLKALGYQFNKELLEKLYKKFIDLADSKTYVDNDDLYPLVQEVLGEAAARDSILLERIEYHCVDKSSSAKVTLSQNGVEFEASGRGESPLVSIWDAVVKAVSPMVKGKLEIKDFNFEKAMGGVEATSFVTLRVESEKDMGYGRASDSDFICAFAKALVEAINHLLHVPVKINNK